MSICQQQPSLSSKIFLQIWKLEKSLELNLANAVLVVEVHSTINNTLQVKLMKCEHMHCYEGKAYFSSLNKDFFLNIIFQWMQKCCIVLSSDFDGIAFFLSGVWAPHHITFLADKTVFIFFESLLLASIDFMDCCFVSDFTTNTFP